MAEDEADKINPDILRFVRCPVTKTPLQVADQQLVESLNSKIQSGQLFNRIGEAVKVPLDGGLINEDRTILLPVRGGILTLVTDEAIELC